jgi:ACS family glucarate transporter-like MFS transporter
MAQQTSVMREPDVGVKRTRWSTVAVVAMFGLVGNMGSLTIGIITPKLISNLGISVDEIGNMSTITGFLGIVIALAAGWAAAKWGSRIVGGVAIILGSIMNLVLPWSSGYSGFLANRIVYSMTSGTPPTTPIGNTELGAAVAPRQRGTAAAIFNFTFPVGAFILGLAGTLVVAGSSWKAWLWILGGVGVVVGIAWLILARGKPYERIVAGTKNALSWGSLARSRTLWGTGIAWGLSAWSFLFLAEFLPLYYIDDRHSQYLGAGLDSTWTWVGGMIGGFFVGIISDALLSRTRNYRVSRTYLAACSEVIFAGLLVWAALASNLTLVMVLLGVAEFFNEIAASIFQVISIDTLGARSARGTGMMCVLVNVFGGFSPYVTSHLFSSGLYTTAFLIAAVTPLAGAALLFWLVYPGELRPWGAKTAKTAETAGA